MYIQRKIFKKIC